MGLQPMAMPFMPSIPYGTPLLAPMVPMPMVPPRAVPPVNWLGAELEHHAARVVQAPARSSLRVDSNGVEWGPKDVYQVDFFNKNFTDERPQ